VPQHPPATPPVHPHFSLARIELLLAYRELFREVRVRLSAIRLAIRFLEVLRSVRGKQRLQITRFLTNVCILILDVVRLRLRFA
jgi:hypothetical protein